MSVPLTMRIDIPTPDEDAAITAAAMADPDNPPLTDGELTQFRRPVGRPGQGLPKVSTMVRFDVDVVTAFRSTGKGWQVRMNEALRDWLKSHSPA